MSPIENVPSGNVGNGENVVMRLKQRLSEARAMGFKVRMEPLENEQATWCEIAGVRTLFVDLSQTASEQLQQVEETLSAYLRGQPTCDLDADLAKRAA